ncbi:nitrate- and nitrite sensing domain-containing protein [Amycolatopsis suaedae]|uniref:sensor histidine kinase n=1 Tax=Amycolatopsis suaedae TaxID=2510978 RepID=UPI001F0EEA2B|nr:nitrate- and nitrite sensing domain-containing protein [Amycolatopsis suaedae]
MSAKLVVVFLVPTIAALFLAGLRIYNGFEETGVYDRAQQRIELSERVAATVHEVQRERETMAAWIISGRPQGRGELDDQITRSDSAANELRASESIIETIDDPPTASRYEQALTRLRGLGELRVSAGDTAFPASAALISYTGVVEALLAVSDSFSSDVTDAGLQERHDALSALAHAKEFSAQQNAFLRTATIRNKFDPAELNSITTAEANLVSAIDSFTNSATPQARQVYSNTVVGEQVSRRFQLQQLALQRAAAGLPELSIDASQVGQASAVTLDLVRQVEEALLADAKSYTGGLLTSVQRELIITSAIIVAGLLIALLTMAIVARSMLRPLRRLRVNALEVANKHLPEAVDRIMAESDPKAAAERAVAPVPVHTTEEIGQVARAFDAVHGKAVQLAAEQSLLRENVNGIFVNLSRRSQRLVERQLGVIDRLEADEQDPDHLASLFELDHLATRLRRNGESLLVLSGAGLAKSVPRPVPAADVIGAAVSEIEQYSRVDVGVVPALAVQGLAIHDLVHLLAELLDNATYFSEPETKVTVRAVMTRRKSLAIQITDKGVGMSDAQLAESNRRLADPPDLDVSVTRRMGLYVVARLAKRHNIEVQLRENEDIDGGTVARVVVPENLLIDLPPSERPPRTDTSLPSIPPVRPDGTPPPPSTGPQPAVRQEPVAQPREGQGLVPLAQPISLDDLVGGTVSAAGPFLTPKRETSPEPAHGADEHGFPQTDVDQPAPAEAPAPPRLELPKREPTYVPVAKAEPRPEESQEEQVGSALDDDVPTRRLPIYQSVLSRWFSEAEDGEAEGGQAEAGEPAEAAAPEGAEGGGVTEGWRSASDEGWLAAQALLESKDEEITPAGLPKRTPNAYLVPGSVGGEETTMFADGAGEQQAGAATGGGAGRSAAAARERMASFQRGYRSGRHALAEHDSVVDVSEPRDDEAVPANGVAGRPSEPSAKE